MWTLDAHLVVTGLLPLSMVSELTESASEIAVWLCTGLLATRPVASVASGLIPLSTLLRLTEKASETHFLGRLRSNLTGMVFEFLPSDTEIYAFAIGIGQYGVRTRLI